MNIVQCLLITAINFFAGSGTSPWGGVLAKYLLQRPFIGGLIVGIIMGNVQQGILIGVAMQIVFLGYFNVGGVSSLDMGTVSIPCVALAMAANLDNATAITLATGIGALSNSFIILVRGLVYPVCGTIMKNGCEEHNEKKVFFGFELGPILGTIIERCLPCFLLLWFGVDAVEAVMAALPANVISALGKVSGWLPCIGMAAMLLYLAKDAFSLLIFVMGFAAYGYLGLNSTSIIFFAIGYAYLVYRSTKKSATEGTKESEEEII